MLAQILRVAGTLLVLGHVPLAAAAAQTDYYNTDAGRPIRTEDAYAIERRAIELQVAPLRLERARGAGYRWGIEPELALGLFPRTQVEIGFPVVHTEGSGARRGTALAGVELSALYNLNTETRLPALALVADVVLPAGGRGPENPLPSLKAIATKTFASARVHANAQWSFGERSAAPSTTPAHAELAQWTAGLAIDKPFPLQSLLLTAEVVAGQPLARDEQRTWDAAAGARYQLSPRLAIDAGGGYRLTGNDPGWFLTTGAAVALGLPWGLRP
jgi:hypothetical protein